MREIWNQTNVVNRQFVPGNALLADLPSNKVFAKAISPLLANDEEINEVSAIFTGLAGEYPTISALRSALRENPHKLELDTNKTKFLLALFIDKLTAAQY